MDVLKTILLQHLQHMQNFTPGYLNKHVHRACIYDYFVV
jgi:hypothetical protein